MNYQSLLPLYNAPPHFQTHWQAVFLALVEPLRMIHFYLRNPGVASLSDEQLKRCFASLQEADSQVERTVKQIDGKSPHTWKVGDDIRMAVGPILEEMFKIISVPDHQMKRCFAVFREQLHKTQRQVDTRPLLVKLRQAMTEEKTTSSPPPDAEAQQYRLDHPTQSPAGETIFAEAGSVGDNPQPSVCNDRPETPFRLTDTMKKILTTCRKKYFKGQTLANKVGLEYNYARKVFSALVKAGYLKNDPAKGYRTV